MKEIVMTRLWLVLVSLCSVPVLLAGQGAVRVSLASTLNAGSVWDEQFNLMGEEWRSISGGRVTLAVYPGGVLGDDRRVIDLMRGGTRPNAATLRIGGLALIDPVFDVLGMPFFFESFDELAFVIEALEPTLDARLEQAGYKRLAWGHAGWVQVFSREPIETLDDLKRTRMYTAAEGDAMIQWYKANGFTPVPLTFADLGGQLVSGGVDAVPLSASLLNSMNLFDELPHMLEAGVGPLTGAVVVKSAVWERIAPDLRPRILAAAEAMQERLEVEVPAKEAEAMAAMQRRGLEVHTPVGAGWDEIRDSLVASMRGGIVEEDLYDQAVKARDAYRAARQ